MHAFFTQKLTPFLRFVRESDFWSTLLLWLLIAGVCVAVSNVVA